MLGFFIWFYTRNMELLDLEQEMIGLFKEFKTFLMKLVVMMVILVLLIQI